MKYTLLVLLTLLLAGCGAPAQPAAETAPPEIAAPAETEETALWTREDLPVAVRYDRHWMYGAVAESEDPELIASLVDAIRKIRLGAVSEYVTEDYTDFVTFTFADGSTVQLEFEAQNAVLPDGTRREVEGGGLRLLRSLLNDMMEPGEA